MAQGVGAGFNPLGQLQEELRFHMPAEKAYEWEDAQRKDQASHSNQASEAWLKDWNSYGLSQEISRKRVEEEMRPIKGDWIPILVEGVFHEETHFLNHVFKHGMREKIGADGNTVMEKTGYVRANKWFVMNRHTGNLQQCDAITTISYKFMQLSSLGFAGALLHGTLNFLKLFVYVPYLLATGRQKEVWGRVKQAVLLPLYQLKMLAITLAGFIATVLVLPILFNKDLIDYLRDQFRQTVLAAKVAEAAFQNALCYAPCMQLQWAENVNNLWTNAKITAIGTRNYLEAVPTFIKYVNIQGQTAIPESKDKPEGCVAKTRSTVSNFFTGCCCPEEPGQVATELVSADSSEPKSETLALVPRQEKKPFRRNIASDQEGMERQVPQLYSTWTAPHPRVELEIPFEAAT